MGLENKKILVGVSGGIAAYKSAELVRELVKAGAQVRVCMTEKASRFITPFTLEVLSGHFVYVDIFESSQRQTIEHVALGEWPDLFLIAPATAQTIAKLANGFADNFLTTTFLVAHCPKMIAPAMNVHMYEHPLTQENLVKLRNIGVAILSVDSGELACGAVGPGRLLEIEKIVEYVESFFRQKKDLAHKKILITAGRTLEPIDSVRYISNHSSGKMGAALVEAALQRGAEVTLVRGLMDIPQPWAQRVERISTAEEMFKKVCENLPGQDIVIMSAAVSDYRPHQYSPEKMKKEGQGAPLISLDVTPDILKYIGEHKQKTCVIGFALETSGGPERAEKKLKEKNCDLVVLNYANIPDSGFQSDYLMATLVDKTGPLLPIERISKTRLAELVFDWIVRQLSQQKLNSTLNPIQADVE